MEDDKARAWADRLISDLGEKDFVLIDVLMAAFRAGHALGVSDANKKTSEGI